LALIFQFVLIAVFALWFWALIDCLRFEGGPGGQRLPWMLVILFGAAPGALVYLLVRRRPRRAMLAAARPDPNAEFAAALRLRTERVARSRRSKSPR
jgi:hypothetical protein